MIPVSAEAERKIKRGYPWILKDEIENIPAQIKDGACVDFVNQKKEFIGFGYINRSSKIAGRILTLNSQKKSITQKKNLVEKLLQNWKYRKSRGFQTSFRLCYGESDQLPGLVVDYYLLSEGFQWKPFHQVFTVQVLTLGMEKLVGSALEIIRELVQEGQKFGLTDMGWEQTSMVLRNDVDVRKWEGLDVLVPQVLKTNAGMELPQSFMAVDSVVNGRAPVVMSCDLYQGQKTGFFLDQTENIRRVVSFLQRVNLKSELKVLDLCCYVGHWSSQLAAASESLGVKVHTTLVDVSEKALLRAAQNAENAGAVVVTHKMDVLQGLESLPSESYDLVIADPPAFIKSKKELPQGQHAYMKMNEQAFRLVQSGGFVSSCSCSGLFSVQDLRAALQKATARQGIEAQEILMGSFAADHPILSGFAESAYLKMILSQKL